MKTSTTKKIFVGVSGGVDSSVVAYLLKQQGHDVHGVFVKTWSPEWLPCTWLDEKRDAMRVCAALDIPFHFLDAEDDYKKGVAEYMIAEYRAGRTPNPDVLCNRVIKFGVMWDYARTHGADAIATGHYARTDGTVLQKGIDIAKDQSYFLWMLQQAELAHVLFPIGHLLKSEVRSIAERARLFTATKKDSQGICFLGDVDMREFLSHYIEQKKGDVVNIEGSVIGTHEGVWFYTLGERHGFHITEKGTNETPYYVVKKDIEHNILVVAKEAMNDSVANGTTTLTLRQSNGINEYDISKTYVAHIRYHGEDIVAHIKNKNEIVLDFTGVIALGQSVVVYDNDIVIGGGIIDSVD